MRIILTTALASALALSGCGKSTGGAKYNPLNWFGKSRSEARDSGPQNPLIPKESAFKRGPAEDQSVLVAQVLAMTLEPTAGGAILRVTGLSPTLGAHNVTLVPAFDLDEDGPQELLSYSLKAEYSARSRPAAPPRSRELSVAVFLSDEMLRGVRSVEVSGAENSRSVRR